MNLSKLLKIIFPLSMFATAYPCSTVIVGSATTNDGSRFISRTVDGREVTDVISIEKFNFKDMPDTFVSNQNSFNYKFPDKINYLGFYMVESNSNKSQLELATNQYNVSISSTETILSNVKTLDLDPYVESGLSEDSIASVVIASAKTAASGAKKLGALIEQYGSSEGYGISFIDNKEIWYLENIGGHGYVAVRLPKDRILISANQQSIGLVDLSDTANVIYSKNLKDLANKLNKKAIYKNKINISEVFGRNILTDIYYNKTRVIRAAQLLDTQGVSDYGVNNGFQVTTRGLDLADLIKVQQDHYNDTIFDPYKNPDNKNSYRPLSVYRTIMAHITQVRTNKPEALSTVNYIALGLPDLSLYMPFYRGVQNLPDSYTNLHQGVFDESKAYWKYRFMQALVLESYSTYAPHVKAELANLQQQIFANQIQLESNYTKLYKESPQLATKLIDDFTRNSVSLSNKMVDVLTMELLESQMREFHSDQEKVDYINLIYKKYPFKAARGKND